MDTRFEDLMSEVHQAEKEKGLDRSNVGQYIWQIGPSKSAHSFVQYRSEWKESHGYL